VHEENQIHLFTTRILAFSFTRNYIDYLATPISSVESLIDYYVKSLAFRSISYCSTY
jgi:hypothetical protein